MEHNKTRMEETVTREEMVSLVKSRGWYSMWNEDNWNSPETANSDWGGRSLKAAYQQCLDDIEMEERVKQGKTIEIKI
jgi:hypothetical protein